MGIPNQTKPAGTLKILWEGLKLPVNNCTLLRPVVTASLLSSSLLSLFSYLCLIDLTTKSTLHKADPESPKFSLLVTAILKDSKEPGIIAVVFYVTSFVVNSLVAIATVHVLSAAYASKIAWEIKEPFSRLTQILIKRAMITKVFVTFLQLGCILIVSLPTGVLSFWYANSSYFSRSTVIIVLGIIVAALAFYWYLYLIVVAQTSVVVSIAEEGCYGLDAVMKACKLIGGGRKQAIIIAFVELTAAMVYTGYGFVMTHFPPIKMAHVAVGVSQVTIGVFIRLFMWSVHTVYYYERSKIRAEEIATEGGSKYNSVPTQVDEALP